ncbi:MAG: hypothetical protein ACYCWW_03950 [Deltaproteobacteria bacterium]
MGANVSNKSSPTAFETSVQKAISGVTNVIPAKSGVMIDGSLSTQAQILQKLQAIVAEYQAIRDARQALEDKLQAARSSRTADHEYLMQLHGALVALFGRKSPVLQQFGYKPMKPTATTAAKKVSADAKRKVTRQMRHVMGSRQKAEVKATGTPDVLISNGVVSITPPAADALVSTPEQSSSGTGSTTPSGAKSSTGSNSSGS